jgi:NADH-quinone oxidoreductase subunit L
LGAGGAFLVWNRDPALDPARALGRARPVFARAFYVDELYEMLIVRPVQALARHTVIVDARRVDATVVGTGRAARWLGGVLRVPQNGNAQAYLTGLLAGVVVITAGVVLFR